MKKWGVQWFPAAKKLVIKLLSTSDSIYLVAESDVIGAASRKNGRCYLFSLSFIPYELFYSVLKSPVCTETWAWNIYFLLFNFFFIFPFPYCIINLQFSCVRVYIMLHTISEDYLLGNVWKFLLFYIVSSFKYIFFGCIFQKRLRAEIFII